VVNLVKLQLTSWIYSIKVIRVYSLTNMASHKIHIKLNALGYAQAINIF